VPTTKIRLATIIGARPQFVKAVPVSRAIQSANAPSSSADAALIDEVLIHTGQHYDQEMSEIFFTTLDLKTPKYNLGVGSGSHGTQLGKMFESLERVLISASPDVVMVYGDTNSTLAGALIADRLHIPVVHVEAGLRSFNRRMPEESNRLITDHLSSLLFAPTETAVKNLAAEGITQNVFLVGDVMHEAALTSVAVAEAKSTILRNLRIDPRSYSLATVHRAENTDDPARISAIIRAFLKIAQSQPLVWPMHPRTAHRLAPDEIARLSACGVQVIAPAAYFDMLVLEKHASVIFTDSGGVQKEAMWFQVPCVTLRDETEWIETVESGWNTLVGASEQNIYQAFQAARQRPRISSDGSPHGPHVSDLIVRQIKSFVAGRQVIPASA
jgi:UDP-GlcNAc3NAcA epimerase